MRFSSALFLSSLLLAGPLAAEKNQPLPGEVLTGPQNGSPEEIARNFLSSQRSELGLTERDLTDLVVTDQYMSRNNGVTHVHFQQTIGDIPVYNAVINVNILPDGSVLNFGSRALGDLESRVAGARSASSSPADAIAGAANHLGIESKRAPEMAEMMGGVTSKARFTGGDVSRGEIPVELIYQPLADGSVRLAWQLNVRPMLGADWWNIRVDAHSNEVLNKNNWTAHGAADDASYLVAPFPHESIGHSGGQTLLVDPFDATASPFGWLDTDGAPGPEFTDTRGNNVFAQEDLDDNDSGGFRPGFNGLLIDGFESGDTSAWDTPTPSASFSYMWDGDLDPEEGQNLSASIVNLFYWNNVMHDLSYHYGFDEASGNFQLNNYGNGGSGNDQVNADALDGSGTNNANFSTPPDGFNPRMQMYRWTAPGVVTVNSPAGIAGDYDAGSAGFGLQLSQEVSITDDVTYVLDIDGVGDACDGNLLPAGSLNGVIALIDRGSCEFGLKVLNAENAGAVAAIIANNAPGAPISMGGGAVGNQVTIASLMLSQDDGNLIKGQLPTPGVNATLGKVVPDRDSDFDAGIIAHEYGHGISNRLSGGRLNSGCVAGDERAGEGWSDFWTLVISAKDTDTGDMARGIGTYSGFEPESGGGIRNFPYTTDMGANPQTYEDIGTTNIPHGVGEIWMSMLWEVYWNLVEDYGFDTDIYFGTGGNNIFMQLVMDGMKLQVCSPTFVEARDAILAADTANNAGANHCSIWTGFAKRGLGENADDGGSTSVGNEVDDFTVPSGVCGP